MQRVIDFLKSILKPNDTIVLGLSGGPDSMCLLELLKSIDIKLNIVCAHINHNIREESKEEALFLKDYCKDLIFETVTFSKKSSNKDYTEAELREKRYEYFENIINKYKAKYLLTAHHGDDLIETILMRITRGSDIKGYAGFDLITDKDNYKVLKPLIYTTKDEINKYNKENNIPFFIDRTNKEDKYTRNRYRNNILPFLKKENKDVHLKYLKFSQELQKYQHYVDKIIDKEMTNRYQDNVLDLKDITKLDSLILESIIKRILDINYPDNLYLVSDKHTKMVIDMINNKKPNISINLPNNLNIKKSYDKLIITSNEDNTPYNIKLDKEVILPNGKKITIVDNSEVTNNSVTRLNSSELKLPLYVRTRCDGDKMIIKNMNNYKKIKDIFIDAKIPMKDRNIAPIVVDSNNNIVWVPNIRKSKFDKEKTDNYDIILWYN